MTNAADPIASPSSEELSDVAILDRAISDYESSIASLDSLDSPMFADERARRIIQRDALRALRARTVKQDLRVAPAGDVPSGEARETLLDLAQAWVQAERAHAREEAACVWDMFPSESFKPEFNVARLKAYEAFESAARSVPLSGASDTTSEEAAATVLYLRCGWCQATTPNVALMGEICPFCNTDGLRLENFAPSPSILQKDTTEGTNER